MMLNKALIEGQLGQSILQIRSLGVGASGAVYEALLKDGNRIAVKVSDGGGQGQLELEGRMLSYLADHSDLPVPKVIHSASDLLIMSLIPNDGDLNNAAQEHAAHLIAKLHSIRSGNFGFTFDTLIGGVRQPNPLTTSWVEFFRDHRVLYMAEQALTIGRLPATTRHNLDRIAGRFDALLSEPAYPALIHGDLWAGNILTSNNRITGFVDPAIYFAHPEVELAFSTLFSTFGEPFFGVYQSYFELDPDFFAVRRHLYNLYPLLVHVYLFGGGYLRQVESIVQRFS